MRSAIIVLAVLAATPALAEKPAAVTAPWPGFAGSFLVARAAEARGDWSTAEAAFADVAARDPHSPEFVHRQTVLLLNQGRFVEAVRLAESISRGSEGTHLARLLVFADAARRNDAVGARLALKDISEDGLGQDIKPFFAAWLAENRKQVQEALRPVSSLSSLESMVKLHEALLAARHNDISAARQNFARLIAATPSYRTFALAAAFYSANDMQDRRNALLTAAMAAGVEPSLVGSLRARDDSDDAVNDLNEGISETLFGLAALLQAEGANDVALPYLHIAVALRPDFALAKLLIGDLLVRLGRYDEARSIYAREAGARDVGPLAVLRLSALETQLDGPVQARSRLEELVKTSPEWIEAWAQLGDTALAAGDLTTAASHISRAIDLTTGEDKDIRARLLYSRAIVHHRLQDVVRAEADLEASLELVPEDAERLNYLGYMWADRGVRLDEAEQLISKAMTLEPNSGHIIDSLGWVKFRAGNITEAVRLLELAAEMVPYNPVINDHLGDAYWAAGRESEARFQWQRSIAYRESGETGLTSVEDLRQKIAQGLGGLRQTAGR